MIAKLNLSSCSFIYASQLTSYMDGLFEIGVISGKWKHTHTDNGLIAHFKKGKELD